MLQLVKSSEKAAHDRIKYIIDVGWRKISNINVRETFIAGYNKMIFPK